MLNWNSGIQAKPWITELALKFASSKCKYVDHLGGNYPHLRFAVIAKVHIYRHVMDCFQNLFYKVEELRWFRKRSLLYYLLCCYINNRSLKARYHSIIWEQDCLTSSVCVPSLKCAVTVFWYSGPTTLPACNALKTLFQYKLPTPLFIISNINSLINLF